MSTILGEETPRAVLNRQVEHQMMNSLRAYGLKAFEALYGVSVASVLVFCVVMFLLAIGAMAVDVKVIDVQHIHAAPQF